MTPRERYMRAVQEAAEAVGVSPRHVMGRDKRPLVSVARDAAFFMMWRETDWSQNRIARIVGRNSTSVRDGIMRHCERHGLAYSGQPVVFTSVRASQ